MQIKQIAFGCDHAGFPYKAEIIGHLRSNGVEVEDFGTYSTKSVDYPDYVHPVSNAVEQGKAEMGILVCGSGNGVCMAANKHTGIRAAMVWRDDIAALARQHNNANVICIPARFITLAEALQFIDTFLRTDFEGGRHERRVQKISDLNYHPD